MDGFTLHIMVGDNRPHRKNPLNHMILSMWSKQSMSTTKLCFVETLGYVSEALNHRLVFAIS